MCVLGSCRPVNNEPVSPVLSSQVTGVSNSSTEFAVQLTFEYSITVSALCVLIIHVPITVYDLCTRIILLYRYVAIGTFQGLYRTIMCS